MIVFDLHCANGHRFEGWFGSSSDFTDQQECGLVICPECDTSDVAKAPMAPAVPAKSNQRSEIRQSSDMSDNSDVERAPVKTGPLPPEVEKAMVALAQAQAEALKQSTWVGDRFAEESRAMHYGERDQAPIHGQASREEAESLMEEGIALAPLPFPVAPPEELN
ncbi:DUF1178 family protein [Altererythrobacter sp. FM1]|uniref:DUF1178 family protein n=1 Tax=Tsuneonella flava TaxID=2055955 RepID=UPI000C80E7F6|nr:DUF1178 family protein [Tsuneonella flava]ROT95245.1 DUF1178 family protein [Altererythrobacter sp. FM1]